VPPNPPAHFQPGLYAITGGEGSGKTRYLRQLCEASNAAAPAALWLDLALPGQDEQTALQVWQALQARCPDWNATLLHELVDALKLQEHTGKELFRLSTGTRRKVALAGLLSAGVALTCLDQPYAALDQASIRVLRSFLHDMADHPQRTWVVADYEAAPQLPWRQVIALDAAVP